MAHLNRDRVAEDTKIVSVVPFLEIEMSFKFVIFWVRWIWYKWRRCISDCNGGCGLVKELYSFLIIAIDDVPFKSLFSYVGGWVYVCKKIFKVHAYSAI